MTLLTVSLTDLLEVNSTTSRVRSPVSVPGASRYTPIPDSLPVASCPNPLFLEHPTLWWYDSNLKPRAQNLQVEQQSCFIQPNRNPKLHTGNPGSPLKGASKHREAEAPWWKAISRDSRSDPKVGPKLRFPIVHNNSSNKADTNSRVLPKAH